MSDKNKLSTQSSSLDRGIKKNASSSSGLTLNSGLLSGHTSFLKTSDGTKQKSELSDKNKVGCSIYLSSIGSSLLSSNLSNPLLGSSNLQNLSSKLTTKSSLSLSSPKLLSSSSLLSSKPSWSLDTGLTSSLKVKPQAVESSGSLTSKLIPCKTDKASLIETNLTKLSLAQSQDPSPVILEKETKSRFKDDTSKVSNKVSGDVTRKRHIGPTGKTIKKSKVQVPSGEIKANIIRQNSITPPDYYIKYEKEDEFMEVELPKFVPPSKDARLTHAVQKSLTDVMGLKRGLINCVSGSLIVQPDFSDRQDITRKQITEHVRKVINYDPEFIMKVALYSRKELNIRTTSNFLLAVASSESSCRIFLKKYFCVSVALPSDWIEIAEIFQTLEDNNLKLGALPSALRKAMLSKFPEFDKYQLAKYNKESSGKKKKAKAKKMEGTQEKKQPEKAAAAKPAKKKRLHESDSSDSEDDDAGKALRQISSISYDEKESEEVLHKQRFTIKQLIRKLHIKEPVEHVMCIIGKKYPKTPEEFYRTRLPGVWEADRAGKRMKLPIPETWETQVSLKGNKAKTWEDLIDHKKLPFMAMLRNLRNLIKAGISPKHHNFVLRCLTDQKSVVNSKQFPFRFFSAYVVLNELEENFEKNQKEIIEAAEAVAMSGGLGSSSVVYRGGRAGHASRGGVAAMNAGGVSTGRVMKFYLKRGRGRGAGRGGRGSRNSTKAPGDDKKFPWWVLKKMKKAAKDGDAVKEVPYDKNLIQRYRKALDTAVQIATVHNVQPIKGRTLLLCENGLGLDKPCSSARGLGKPRTVREIIILMGLMCKYSCEECQMLVFDDSGGFTTVELNKGTILDNMEKVLKTKIPKSASDYDSCGLPFTILLEKLRDRIQVDNLLVFGEDFYPGSGKGRIVCDWLHSYRLVVNPDLLFVSVTFSAPRAGFVMDVHPEHDNDIYISGYSDSILRFIAERGDAGQVNHVDKIDVAFQLRPMPKVRSPMDEVKPLVIRPDCGLPLMSPIPSWRTVRVFISSTFKDMHGERDLLTRFVFPELRALAHNRFINIYDIDLRWGVTEEMTKDNSTLDVCLQGVSCCQLFVGLLGERYGWIPDSYQVPDIPEYNWVHQYPPGASVTELEMYLGALSKAKDAKDTAFFYFRDNSFEKDVPELFASDFKSESEAHRAKMMTLKKKIRNSGLEVYDGYPCRWGGFVEGKPIVAGLEDFGARVLNTLANAVTKLCPEQGETLSEDEHIHNLQWAFINSCSAEFVGRKTLVGQIITKISSTNSGIIGVVGKPGSGKTAVMASAIMQYVKSKHSVASYSVLVNMVGSTAGSNNLTATLRRLAHQINKRFGLGYTLPEDFKNLTLKFKDLLEEAANMCTSRLVLFLDGLDQMEAVNDPFSLEWMPRKVPDNVVFVISAVEGDKTHKSLKRLEAQEITVGGLDMWDKADIVRQTLAKHRKSLDESGFGNQMKLLMLKKDAHNPLYLKLACEELRVFGVFEKISDKLKSLPHTTAQLLQEILLRLEEDHGKNIVSVALCLLTCARDGLYPEELYQLLNLYIRLTLESEFEPKDIFNIYLENPIPPLTFIFLTRSIVCFLNPGSTWTTHLSLASKEISVAVRLRYLKGPDAILETKLHKLLAGFFLKQADPQGNNTWRGQNLRAFSELPYHLAWAGNFCELEETICNHHFIQSKCSLGLASKLMDDFTPKVNTSNRVQEKELAHFLSQQKVQQYRSFVSRNVEIFVSYPSLVWQQAVNEPNNSIPCKDARLICITDKTLPPYVEWSSKPETESPCYMTLSNLKMTCVAISPDFSKIAAGSQDLLVRLYDMGTGKELRFFTGHADHITSICFVGSNMLCSASADASLSIWDVENGHRIHTLKDHNRRVNSCASDRAGRLVVSGGWDCTVYVWKAFTGEKLCDFDVGSPVNCVDFHPSQEQIVAGSWDSLIRIYNYFHKTRIAILRGHSTSVRDIAYSFDGHHLASASLDGDVKIWAAEKGSQVGSIKGHSGPVNKLTFSPTGKELITAGDDHQIKVWSGDLGIPVHRLHTDHLGSATSLSISPNGATVAIGYHLGQVRIYDVSTGVKLAEVKVSSSAVRAITFSKDGNYIYAGCDDNYVQVLESNQGSRKCSLLGHTKPVLCVDTMKTYIATGGEDFICCLYEDIQQLKSSKQSSPKTVLKGHVAPVSACSFSSDGTKLATASRDASVRIYILYDVFISVAPEPAQVLHSCHNDWINSCCWSNTGNFLVTASNDFNLKVWDTNTGTEKTKIMGHSSAINTVAYKYGCIVSGSSDGDVRVWSHKGTPITTLSGHTMRVNACDIYVKCKIKEETNEEETPKQSWAEVVTMEVDESNEKKKKTPPVHHSDVNMQDVIVASAGDDGDVWIWKPLQPNNLACLTGHSDRVLSVDVDKRNHIASCSLDHSLRLWQPKLQEEINLSKHNASVTFVCAALNGSTAVSGSRDGVIKIWTRNDGTLFQIKHSFQGHEKAVNCCCFAGYETDKFVTGGDDNYIHIWEMQNRKEGFYVRKQKTLTMKLPVAGVAMFPGSGTIFVSSWTGYVFSVNINDKEQTFHTLTNINPWYFGPPKERPGAIVLDVDKKELVVGTTRSYVACLNLASDLISLESTVDIPIFTDNIDKDLPAEKRPPNWINCVVRTLGLTFAGDTRGQLLIHGPTVSTYMKVHSSAITALEVAWDIIITGSDDCSIKVWTYTISDSVHLTQVGQFFCPSPVVSMKIVSATKNGASTVIPLLVGDQLGNIHQLCWRS